MSSEFQEEASSSESSHLFQKLEDYPWDSDEEFQAGLRAILDSDSAREDTEALTLQARCFYYAQKNDCRVDIQAYQQWRTQHGKPLENRGDHATELHEQSLPEQQSDPGKPPYPLSFNRLVELITEGKEVPGIKEIPNTLLEGQASQSIASQRRKPWEQS